jgi:hypothetical protein
MRNLVLALAATALLALPAAAAEDAYSFHVRSTDGRTALQANPNLAELKMTPEQLERAAKDRVLLLNRTSGSYWSWLMLSWPEKTEVEHGINLKGTGKPDSTADLGLAPKEDGTIRVRCLREQCRLNVTLADDSLKTAELKNDETKDFPLDSYFEVWIKTADE